jgi:hypothetical protein
MKELLIKCDGYKFKMFIDDKEVEVINWVIKDGYLDHEINVTYNELNNE